MKDIKIKDCVFSIQAPYTEGKKISAVEANALNQMRAENIRNNMTKKAKAQMKAAEVENVSDLTEFPAEVAEYDKQYIFAVQSKTQALSAEEREAIKLARVALNATLASKGRKVRDVRKDNPEWYEEKLAEIASREAVVLMARKVLETRDSASNEAIDF